MRNFSLIGLLLVVAIIGYWAKSEFAPSVSHDPNDKATVEYWVSHDSDRQTMLSYCNAHPDQQNTQDCKLAIAAQTQVRHAAAGGAKCWPKWRRSGNQRRARSVASAKGREHVTVM